MQFAQERYGKSVLAADKYKESQRKQAIVERVVTHFSASHTNTLNKIYDEVAADFSRYYRIINREDEEKFEGTLSVPDPSKLSFDVDFYGRGKFPPGAYHSEGHSKMEWAYVFI